MTLTSSTGVLASNVVALKFDFTSPASENGFCGYGAITAFGNASIVPPAVLSSALLQESNSLVMNVSGLFPGWGYVLQSTTNLTSPNWIAEADFIGVQSALNYTSSTVSPAQKFFRVVTH